MKKKNKTAADVEKDEIELYRKLFITFVAMHSTMGLNREEQSKSYLEFVQNKVNQIYEM